MVNKRKILGISLLISGIILYIIGVAITFKKDVKIDWIGLTMSHVGLSLILISSIQILPSKDLQK